MFRRLIPFFLLVFVLTGCVRQHVDITVQPDGTKVDIDMIAAADTEWAKEQGIDLDAKAQENQVDASSFGPEARFEKFADGKWVGQHLIAPNTPMENVTNGGLLTYTHEGDTLTFTTSPRQLGWGAESSNFDEVVNSEADLRLRVKVPGQVQETNGKLEGEWVVWTTRDAALESFTLSAKANAGTGQAFPTAAPEPTPTPDATQASKPGMPWWIWLVLLAISLGVGYGVYRYLGKK